VGFGFIISAGRGGRKSIADTRQIRLFGCACLCVCPSCMGWALEEGEEIGAGGEYLGSVAIYVRSVYIPVARCRRVLIVRPRNFARAKTIGYTANVCHLYVIFGAHDGPFSQIRPWKIILYFSTSEKRVWVCTWQPKRRPRFFFFFFLRKITAATSLML